MHDFDEAPISYNAPPSETESNVSDPEYVSNSKRSSSEAGTADRDILEEDEERNELLTRHRNDGQKRSAEAIWAKGTTRRQNEGMPGGKTKVYDKDGTRQRNRGRGNGRRELLHSMEEGGDGSRTPSSDGSSDIYTEKVGRERPHTKVRFLQKRQTLRNRHCFYMHPPSSC